MKADSAGGLEIHVQVERAFESVEHFRRVRVLASVSVVRGHEAAGVLPNPPDIATQSIDAIRLDAPFEYRKAGPGEFFDAVCLVEGHPPVAHGLGEPRVGPFAERPEVDDLAATGAGHAVTPIDD